MKTAESEKPDLTGRMSRCEHRSHIDIDDDGHGSNNNGRQTLRGTVPVVTPSSWGLPFFRYRPGEEYDSHYCGCFGWS